MRQEIDRIGGDELSRKPLEVELARLGAEVEDIASSLDRRITDEGRTDQVAAVAERSAGEAGEARVAEEMQRLEGEQASLKAQIESLRADFAAAQESRVPVPAAELRSGEPTTEEAEQGVTPAAEAGPEDIAAVAQEPPTDASGAGADADADALGSGETLMAGEGSYALQLIGFFDRDSLAAFAARDGLPARVYYLRQTHKGRPWYALVHSLHEGYAAAAEERSRLPADLVALSPWIRPLPAGTELRVLGTGPAR
jgi:DamX protein